MNRFLSVGLAMLAGVALGATAIKGLGAQGKPPTYLVIDITEMTDPNGFKAVTARPEAGPARVAALGGRALVRTETTVALDGAPPKRFVLYAFDSIEKARGWYDAPDIKELTAIRRKTTKSSAFIVEGLAN